MPYPHRESEPRPPDSAFDNLRAVARRELAELLAAWTLVRHRAEHNGNRAKGRQARRS